MVQLQYSPKYLSSRAKFLKNNQHLLNKVIKAISLFIHNPKHPSLNLEKLKGSDYWTIRIDKGNRIFFTWIDESTVLFIDIGEHDKYRRY
jgi:mRNA-degrading endonuclease RelE of RelBE toxin-antitoxin system